MAAEVGAVPAALYRHVASLDELVDGVLGRVFAGVQLEPRPRAPWTAQLRDWMTSLRIQLLRYPAVLSLLGRRGRTSPAWLEVAAALTAILERSGLCGAALARAQLWVAEAAVGHLLQEASLPLRDQIDAARAALGEMSATGRERLGPLMEELASIDAEAQFAFVVERTLAGLVELVEREQLAVDGSPARRTRGRRSERALGGRS